MRRLLASLALVACANAPQREEAVPPLVVPPLTVNPGAANEAAEPRVDVKSSLAIPARDPRASMRAPRPAAELRAEIAKLEQETTASGQHSLGEAYCELARVDPGSHAREKAIATLDEVVTKFPQYPALDEALYDLALETEIAGDRIRARRWYYELIKRRPTSQYIPFAYFAFGELFFEEATSDPSKLPLAEQAYLEVLKYPQSPIRADAQARLDDIKKR